MTIALIPNVLVMDDEKPIRHDYRQTIHQDNFLKVLLAATAGRAEKIINSKHIDAAIIDVRMTQSGSEGLEIVQMVRSKHSWAYIEVITAFHEFEEAAIQRGADNVVFKPILAGKLRNYQSHIWEGILTKRVDRLQSIAKLDIPSAHEAIKTQIATGRRADWLNLGEELYIMRDQFAVIRKVLEDEESRGNLRPSKSAPLFETMTQSMVKTVFDKYSLEVRHNGNGNNLVHYSPAEPESNVQNDDKVQKIPMILVQYDWLGCLLLLVFSDYPEITHHDLRQILVGEKVDLTSFEEVLSKMIEAKLILAKGSKLRLSQEGEEYTRKMSIVLEDENNDLL